MAETRQTSKRPQPSQSKALPSFVGGAFRCGIGFLLGGLAGLAVGRLIAIAAGGVVANESAVVIGYVVGAILGVWTLKPNEWPKPRTKRRE